MAETFRPMLRAAKRPRLCYCQSSKILFNQSYSSQTSTNASKSAHREKEHLSRQDQAHESNSLRGAESAARPTPRLTRASSSATSTSTGASARTDTDALKAAQSKTLGSGSNQPNSKSVAEAIERLGADPNAAATWVPKRLPGPLGVLEPPTSASMSWKQRTDRMLDPDHRAKMTKVVARDWLRGYFWDYKKLLEHGGKLWVAPERVLKADQALYFPDIKGVSLRKTVRHTTDMFPNKVSLVAILPSLMAESQVETWTPTILSQFENDSDFQFIQINHQENLLKGFIVSLMVGSLRKKTPPKLHETYLLSVQNMELIRESIGMANKHIGYLYLVDDACRIRWAGVAFPTENERKDLGICITILLERLKAQMKAK